MSKTAQKRNTKLDNLLDTAADLEKMGSDKLRDELRADPVFMAAVEHGRRFELAQEAADKAAAPFEEGLRELSGTHPSGSEKVEQFQLLARAAEWVRKQAFAKHGFRVGASDISPAKTMKAHDTGKASQPTITFSDDYRWCRWGSDEFTFSDKQALAVRMLAEAYRRDNGAPVPQLRIQACVSPGSHSFDLHSFFRRQIDGERTDHPAWGRMIVKVERGYYRIADPE